MNENIFIDTLKVGVKNTTEYMELITDFHGGAVKIEYILTVDVARAFLSSGFDTYLEYHNRRVANAMVHRQTDKPLNEFGRQRIDVAVVESGLIPQALVEVKINVTGSLKKIEPDIIKICRTIDNLGAQVAKNVFGASVFQIRAQAQGHHGPHTKVRLLERMRKKEVKLQEQLKAFGAEFTNFTFEIKPLISDSEAFHDVEVFESNEGPELGRPAHMVAYYAVLIRSVREPEPMKDNSLRERLRRR